MRNEKISGSVNSLMIVITILVIHGCSPGNPGKELSEMMGFYIDTLKMTSPVLDGERIYNPDIIIKLYTKNGMAPSPIWGNRSNITRMVAVIHDAVQDGLLPDDYHHSELEKLIKETEPGKRLKIKETVRLDLMLTDAFVVLSSHLEEGKTDPETIDPQWNVSRRSVINHWDKFIDSTLLSGNVIGAIQDLTPRHREYNNLKKALIKYRQYEEKGGWQPFITDLKKLEPGMRHPDITMLRKRLSVTQGDIECIPGEEDLFDKTLQEEVIAFQKANGLDPDGVVGKTTIEALNIPVEQRIETLEANLERWRWIRDDLGKRYIRVNIPDFSMQLLEDNKPVFHSLAVVGRPFRQTPVFSSSLRYLVVNPDWVVPTQIIREEIVPEIIKDQKYLSENNMKILRMDGTEVEPSSINWGNIVADEFPFMIREEPGAKNPLGKVAFMFPNEYSVYIHDTPSQYLFSKSSRAFSHGCIRINKALELAEYLMRDTRGWDTAHLQQAILLGKKEIISLRDPIPVYILYLTASADDDGSAIFAKDIYDRDQVLINALNEGPSVHRNSLAGSGYISETLPNKPGASFIKRDNP